jgi:polysaccharide export outer membrane protein
MFKTGAKYEFDDISEIDVNQQYKIGINDELIIETSPNKGALLMDGASQIASNSGMIVTIVEFDGSVKVPVLGPITLAGLSKREAELLLEERYRAYFIDPFVRVKINNKRVIIFAGEGGSARVLILKNENTTLLEAIASSGGINGNAKADRVKLIRKDELGVQKVYLIDLSKINGLYSANTVLQGNDIVYIEPRNDYALNFANRAAGYFFVFNILLLLNSIIK